MCNCQNVVSLMYSEDEIALIAVTCQMMCTMQGCLPTVARAMVVNAAQLASYSQAKQLVLSTGENNISTVPAIRSSVLLLNRD